MNRLNRMLAPLGDAFLDYQGGTSTMRIMSMLVVIVVLANWVACCWLTKSYVPFGYAEAGVVTASLGAKAAQSHFEIGREGL